MSHTKIALPFIVLAVVVTVCYAYDGSYGGSYGSYGGGGDYGASRYGRGKRDTYGSNGGYGSMYGSGGSLYGRGKREAPAEDDKSKMDSASDTARTGRGRRESEHGDSDSDRQGRGKREAEHDNMMSDSFDRQGRGKREAPKDKDHDAADSTANKKGNGKQDSSKDQEAKDSARQGRGRRDTGYAGNYGSYAAPGGYGNPVYGGNSGYGNPSGSGIYGRKRRDLSAAGQIPQAKFAPVRGPKQFSVNVADGIHGANQVRKEKWDNGTMTGMYANPLGNGKYQVIEYIADDKGYRILSTKVVDESELSADKFNPLAGKKQAQVEINNDGSTTSYTVTPDQIAKNKQQKMQKPGSMPSEAVEQNIEAENPMSG